MSTIIITKSENTEKALTIQDVPIGRWFERFDGELCAKVNSQQYVRLSFKEQTTAVLRNVRSDFPIIKIFPQGQINIT